MYWACTGQQLAFRLTAYLLKKIYFTCHTLELIFLTTCCQKNWMFHRRFWWWCVFQIAWRRVAQSPDLVTGVVLLRPLFRRRAALRRLDGPIELEAISSRSVIQPLTRCHFASARVIKESDLVHQNDMPPLKYIKMLRLMYVRVSCSSARKSCILCSRLVHAPSALVTGNRRPAEFYFTSCAVPKSCNKFLLGWCRNWILPRFMSRSCFEAS
jgi:hypothetical protein